MDLACCLQFISGAGLYPYTDFWAWADYVSTAVFGLDMVFKVSSSVLQETT